MDRHPLDPGIEVRRLLRGGGRVDLRLAYSREKFGRLAFAHESLDERRRELVELQDDHAGIC